jgi:hypothetical protein
MWSAVAEKLIITVTGAKLLHVHSVSPFSEQPLTPFESLIYIGQTQRS